MKKNIILTIIGFFVYTQHNLGMLQGNILTQNGVTRTTNDLYIKYETHTLLAKYSIHTGEYTVQNRITGHVMYTGLAMPSEYDHLAIKFNPLAHHA